jgi:hypothetical protein
MSMEWVPVRIFWKASSTLEASNADVSMNDNPFSADVSQLNARHTGKGFCFFCGDGSEMSQIGLVADQHDDNVGICMITKLFEPAYNILIGNMLGNIVHE